jgi:hypothetical protein
VLRSELQAALAGAFGNGLHTAVVQEAATVKDHSGDTGFFGAVGKPTANFRSGRDVSTSGTIETFLNRRGGGNGAPSEVVDDLGVDMFAAAEHREARPSGAAADATLETATATVATVLSELDAIHEKLPWAQPIDLPTLRMTNSST